MWALDKQEVVRILEAEGSGQRKTRDKTEQNAFQGGAGYLTPRTRKGGYPWGKQGPNQSEGQIQLSDRHAQGSLCSQTLLGGDSRRQGCCSFR